MPCYGNRQHAGELIDFERTTRSRDEVMAEWALLRSEGYGKRQAAERLGMTFAAFDRALQRATQTPRPATAGRGQ
jgi:hypothetical protein